MASWADVVAAGAGLPGVEEGTWYGTSALTVRGKGGHAYVLARLARVGEETLRELIEDTWRGRAPESLQ